MKNDTNASLQALQASGEQLSHDLAAVASNATDLVKDVGTRQYQAVRHGIDATGRSVSDGMASASASTERYVTQHPWVAMAAVGGVCLALGLLLARR